VADLQIIGTGIGVAGALLAGINTWQRCLDTKLKVSFELLAYWIDEGRGHPTLPLNALKDHRIDMGAYTEQLKVSAIGFMIRNLSRFPVWIEEAGFSIGESLLPAKKQASPCIIEGLGFRHDALPFRLESGESRIYYTTDTVVSLKEKSQNGCTHAYIKTGTGVEFYENIEFAIKYVIDELC
jgi:hypothetical protein